MKHVDLHRNSDRAGCLETFALIVRGVNLDDLPAVIHRSGDLPGPSIEDVNVSLREDVLDEMRRSPGPLLAEILWWLQTAARGLYPEAGTGQSDAIRGLKGINELGLVITAQLRSLDDPEPAYPLEAFVDTLNEKAAASGRGQDLRWSTEQALMRLRKDTGS